MNKKLLGLLLILVIVIGAVLFFVLGGNDKEPVNNTEPEVVDKDETPYSDTYEEIQEKRIEAGKKIDLTEEEMIETGKDLVKKYQSLWNVKNLEEFDVWYNETLLTKDYYDSFKEYITYGDTELVSVDFENVSVIANSPFSYQWSGIITVKFKSFSENKLYTKKYNFVTQIATNDTVKEYRIFTVSPSTETLESKTEPLQ